MPIAVFSAWTSISTSIDEVKARFTRASITTTSPRRIGEANSTWSTLAVTTTRPAWRIAAMPPQTSIRCSRRPPMRLPSGLVSFGSTSSVMRHWLSAGVFVLVIGAG